jgi:hypothetical protein
MSVGHSCSNVILRSSYKCVPVMTYSHAGCLASLENVTDRKTAMDGSTKCCSLMHGHEGHLIIDNLKTPNLFLNYT